MTESLTLFRLWGSRLEARLALTLALLLTIGLALTFVVTTSVVSSQSRDRAARELEVARSSFHAQLDERVRSATSEAELVTQLPVFRAHLTDSQLTEDRATIEAMATGYREQLQAQFVVVTRQGGAWAAHPGWQGDPASAGSRVQAAVQAALDGRRVGAIVEHDGGLYLTVSVPARFADEVLGSLTLGYTLTDELAEQLARLARCEAVLVFGGRMLASSLGQRATASDADALVALAGTPRAGVLSALQRIGDGQYVAGSFPIAAPVLGGEAGRLVLLSNWEPTQHFIDTLRQRFAITGLAVLALSLGAGALFSRRISRPLRDVAAAVTEVSAGNLEMRLPERGPAESVAVARAFNEMSASLRAAQHRLMHDATHDPLTHLPNRTLFMERLERAMVRRARYPQYTFAVLFVDLDRFKHVNDSLGHGAGDTLLLLFAHRLAMAVRRDDAVMRVLASDSTELGAESTLARFGGDEFVVLLDDISDPIDAVRVAERIQQLSTLPLRVEREDVFTMPSIGVAVCTAAHRFADDVVRDADLAMHKAKQRGGNCFAVADVEMHANAVHRLRLETELRRAVERDELRVRYQPIVSLADREVVGFEALVRWHHPNRGLLSPADFLGVADEVGLATQIDAWVLREACRQGREWVSAAPGAAPFTLSVNLSPNSFVQPTLVQGISETLAATGFPADRLRIEITEGTAIKDAARARVVLTELRALGVRVSIDDFGTGYSSLSYLQMFPVDLLKIDRSFVARLGPNANQGEVVHLIVSLANTLGLDVVAEGTETEEQVRYLRQLGCTYGQGYFFAAPLDAAEIVRGTLPGSAFALDAASSVAANAAPASPDDARQTPAA